MAQIAEIERLILAGHRDRPIARMLRCRRLLVAAIRKRRLTQSQLEESRNNVTKIPPPWVFRVDWQLVENEIKQGHPLKFIWQEFASELTSHSNFFKYIKSRFENLLSATVTLREFRAGEHCEVDYAGDKIEWVDARNGEIHQAHIFIGILCFSQKIFAWAAEDEKKPNWLDCHRRMFEFYQGSPQVLVCDNLKTGVTKAHRYDPDLNPEYVELAAHYGCAVVPARSRSPKDKALAEGGVKIVMRYFSFVYRRRTFTSLSEVNRAFRESIDKINSKIHTRFRVSRESRFTELEKNSLRRLPMEPYELSEIKTMSVHPDCTVNADKNFYSAPHTYRHKEVRVKISTSRIEIFFDLDRIALHKRAVGKVGERIIEIGHLPENSRAYLEATPKNILAQAKFSHVSLHDLIDEIFQKDTLGNLRRAQGLVRKAYLAIQAHGDQARPWIESAVHQMKRIGRVRVKYFEELLKAQTKKKTQDSSVDRTIVRQPGNPMVRGHGAPKPKAKQATAPQLTLI